MGDIHDIEELQQPDGSIRAVQVGINRWYVSNATEGDEEMLDFVTDAERLSRNHSTLSTQFAHIRSLQDRLWDLRQPSIAGPGGDRVGGIGDMKWVASIPKKVAFMAELAEPNLFKDPKVFYNWLTKHPEYSTRRH